MFSQTPTFGQNWSRNKYDKELYNIDVKQSTAPLVHILDPTYTENSHRCLPNEVGYVSKQGVSWDSSRPIVDTESDLFNLNRILTKDPSYKYRPACTHGDCIGVINECNQCQPKLQHFNLCNDHRYECTRLTNPVSNLRSTGVNRFQPLNLNPQDPTRWQHPGEIGINYRMIVKDNHVPHIPKPLDMSSVLPVGGEIPCQPITNGCYPPIVPLHNHYILNARR